ncbi:MAG: DUF58 domain-containing protein [Planctomycetota bacterium]|jgi:uncharacterized protein (DUF58 family)|nr:DUF58 domain-containing protein [Planctomycetota bacterium]
MADTAQLSSVLGNEVIARIERLRLAGSNRFTDRTRGDRITGRGGSSIEFADYRDYQHGDDIRGVDWNIFARLGKPYLKLYRQEQERHVTILIDTSASMGFGTKLHRARQFAAACAIMGLIGGERVSIYLAGHEPRQVQRLGPVRGRPSLRRVLAFLEDVSSGGAVAIDQAVDAMLARHHGRGLCVVLSDFLTEHDPKRLSGALFAAGLETWAVQILDPIELDPSIEGDQRLVDSETGAHLDVSGAGGLLGLYQEHLASISDELATACKGRGGRAMQLSAGEDFTTQLFDRWRRAGWVR